MNTHARSPQPFGISAADARLVRDSAGPGRRRTARLCRDAGRRAAHAGSLYRALNRLLEAGLIEDLDERPDPEDDDERRRYYRLTRKGLDVARGEARRLERQVEAARQRRLLPGGNA